MALLRVSGLKGLLPVVVQILVGIALGVLWIVLGGSLDGRGRAWSWVYADLPVRVGAAVRDVHGEDCTAGSRQHDTVRMPHEVVNTRALVLLAQ